VRVPACATVSASGGGSVTACVGPANDKVATFTGNGCLTIS
jgi:hypothetical protein